MQFPEGLTYLLPLSRDVTEREMLGTSLIRNEVGSECVLRDILAIVSSEHNCAATLRLPLWQMDVADLLMSEEKVAYMSLLLCVMLWESVNNNVCV